MLLVCCIALLLDDMDLSLITNSVMKAYLNMCYVWQDIQERMWLEYVGI